jgi:hypothetical protein
MAVGMLLYTAVRQNKPTKAKIDGKEDLAALK